LRTLRKKSGDGPLFLPPEVARLDVGSGVESKIAKLKQLTAMQDNPYESPMSSETAAANQPLKPRFASFTFSGVFPAIVLAWTASAIAIAAADKSYGALATAFLYGPAGNGLIALLGTIYLGVRRPRACGAEAVIMVVCVLASTLAIIGSIFSMDLHGC
jgi:hypothetical protein